MHLDIDVPFLTHFNQPACITKAMVGYVLCLTFSAIRVAVPFQEVCGACDTFFLQNNLNLPQNVIPTRRLQDASGKQSFIEALEQARIKMPLRSC